MISRPVRALALLAALAVTPQWATGEGARVRENFDGHWRFHLGEIEHGEAPVLQDSSWRQLDVPHDWSAEADFSPMCASGTGFLPGGVGWYRKTFTLPETARKDRFLIEFDGVSRDSDVWINGVHLGNRPSGYIHFHYDLTPHLRFGDAENVIAVCCQRENVADSRWYPGTGIYRHAWLTRTGPVHVAPWGVFVTTPRVTPDGADICTTTHVVNESIAEAIVEVTSRVLDSADEEAARVVGSKRVPAGDSVTFSDWQVLPTPALWSPGSPTLYTLVTEVRVNGTLVDEVETPFGVRTCRFDPEAGFFLNGRPTLLKGVCMHHDGGGVGAAVPEAVWRRRLELVKDLGGNAVRCSHNPMAPEFYDLCDELGLLVMDEAFDEWEIGKRKWVLGRNVGLAARFGYSEAFEEWAERDLADQVLAHRNHPSIIMWSIGNEIDYPTDPYVHPESRHDPDFDSFSLDGQPSVTRLAVVAPRLIATVKRHDPTRPVTMALANVPAANGIGLANMLDVAGYNYQEQFYEADRREFPGRVILGSENGLGLGAWEHVRDRADISGLFYWVGFDFLGEADRWPNHGSMAGIFDRCGFVKPWCEQIRALWSERPVASLMVSAQPRPRAEDGDGQRQRRARRGQFRGPAHHWNWATEDDPAGDAVKVTVFANTPAVELKLNGQSLGKKSVDKTCTVTWELTFEPGELEVVGLTDDGEIVARDRLRTAGPPARLEATRYETAPLAPGDACHVTLRVVDAEGTPVPQFESPVTVAVSGGKLLSVDNGMQRDPTPLSSATRTPASGRLLVVLEQGADGEPLTLTAEASGLETLTFPVADK
ncbi:MAG: DUF4982 domain-containing protein [Planctomycetales bacterium]|nr:DUF4982 domain-containing protein [Planctomycetales bacterium]